MKRLWASNPPGAGLVLFLQLISIIYSSVFNQIRRVSPSLFDEKVLDGYQTEMPWAKQDQSAQTEPYSLRMCIKLDQIKIVGLSQVSVCSNKLLMEKSFF